MANDLILYATDDGQSRLVLREQKTREKGPDAAVVSEQTVGSS